SRGTRAFSGSLRSRARLRAYRCNRQYRTLFFCSLHFSALLLRPAFPRPFLAFIENQRAGGNVMTNRRCSGDVNVIAQRDRRNQRGIASDLHSIANFGSVLLKPVVIAGNGPGADIAVPPDRHVSEIGKMVGLCPFAELRFFGLDKIPDVHIWTKSSSRPKVGKRPDDSAMIDPAARKHHREFQMHLVADLGIREIRTAVDLAPFAHDGATSKVTVGADNSVFADKDRFFDVRRLWIFERHAGSHPLAVDSLLQSLFHPSELLSGINPHHFARLVYPKRGDFLSFPQTDGCDIRQIVLRLAVVTF